MQNELIARPTEYNGVRYRSKCEAMFALCKDLSTKHVAAIPYSSRGFYRHRFAFVYEPKWFVRFTGFVPDFVEGIATCAPDSPPRFRYEIIEYKPSMPTNTYISEWTGKCQELSEALPRFGVRCADLEFSLYHGSVFNDERSVLVCSPKTKWECADYDYDWLENYEESVRSYRFDLNDKMKGL